jgi:dTDP-glucose 4,6-dehydratase
MASILVTGAAGFIGSNFVLHRIATADDEVVSLDALTYAGNLANLQSIAHVPRHHFVHGNICDAGLMADLFKRHRPRAVVHFAAESHVDRSIHGPAEFIRTNVDGTFTLLQAALEHWATLSPPEREDFRFLHVSTDEVYGSLAAEDPAFTEDTPYRPNSPYAASKAASDHLVRAWHHTYGMPTLTTNCSNNYGPYQFPEKLIPLMIMQALEARPLPVYGDGLNVRDWLHVADHCEAISTVLARGRVGETYNIGGGNEVTNLQVVRALCRTLDRLVPAAEPHERLISFVSDRRGHDRRYAVDASRIARELGWRPSRTFDAGLEETVRWYLDHRDWVRSVTSGEYRQWLELNYVDR